MRKAVAIPYVIALVLGIIVVVALAYWFISSGSKGSNIGKDAECVARKTEFCTTQSALSLERASKVCTEGFDDLAGQCSFCGSIMPGWRPQSGVPCPKPVEGSAGK